MRPVDHVEYLPAADRRDHDCNATNEDRVRATLARDRRVQSAGIDEVTGPLLPLYLNYSEAILEDAVIMALVALAPRNEIERRRACSIVLFDMAKAETIKRGLQHINDPHKYETYMRTAARADKCSGAHLDALEKAQASAGCQIEVHGPATDLDPGPGVPLIDDRLHRHEQLALSHVTPDQDAEAGSPGAAATPAAEAIVARRRGRA